MYIFSYPKQWADLITAQMYLRKETTQNNDWGFACICVGREFDKVIEKHYLDIDRVTGDKLHVFSMTPPPQDFIFETLAKVQRLKSPIPHGRLLEDKLEELIRYSYYPERKTMISEKVSLLRDLADSGLNADQYADFIFFEIRELAGNNYIDVVASKRTNLGEGATEEDYINLFEKMGNKAKEHYAKGNSVDEFVKDISTEWSFKLSIKEAAPIAKFIMDLINLLRGK